MQNAREEFWRLYRNGEFFEAHEALEDLWRAASGKEKQELHGLIHGAVARLHHARGNDEGAARQMVRMTVRLRPFTQCANTQCAKFVREVETVVAPSLQKLDGAARERLVELEKRLQSTVEF